MKEPLDLSIVIPTYNDGELAITTISNIQKVLSKSNFGFEINVVDDSDGISRELLEELTTELSELNLIDGDGVGFGYAIRKGIREALGHTVIVMMGDGSEDPEDIYLMMKKRQEGFDVVLGNRFGENNRRKDYPKIKYWVNRMMNIALKLIFRIPEQDITNAFTAYNRKKLEELNIESDGFELSIEMPIKLIKNGASCTSVDVAWLNRIEGESKMRLLAVGKDYWKLVFKILLKR